MGMQGPLTAQALGRSPYDEVVDGEGEDDPRHPTPQHDHRGRPINPETKRMNRDIIRAHNEVMLVIGVAEPENPYFGPEAESQRRHQAYEESMSLQLAIPARRCIDSVGIFGVHGLRQRILIPFWESFQRARVDFSFTRDVLSGAPTAFLTNYIERTVTSLWLNDQAKQVPRRVLHEIWSYLRVHLELHVAMQRLGILSNVLWLPQPSFFIPFTKASPIPAPPSLEDYTMPSLLKWVGGVLISATPFLVWVMAQRMVRDWKPQIWSYIFRKLPNTMFQGKKIPPPPPLPPPTPPHVALPLSDDPPRVVEADEENSAQVESSGEGTPEQNADSTPPGGPSPQPQLPRRASLFSTRGDEYPSDDEDNEGVTATLISFDVEASESQDAPPGLWSAELRPSAGSDPRLNGNQQPVYWDSLLTQMPAAMATHMLADALTRVLMAPYEATALRLIARSFRSRQGLPISDIYNANMLSGFTSTALVNFLGAELLHINLASEIWAIVTCVSQWFHMTEEEWKSEEKKT
ncbi:uncharacterized protein MAM_00468 [Metarhizium album ARSEF 1941]|uniref:Uncharacterized protein n=1 Tax=Metarhizium album (strain ARSEF 1941) TaxID=1081103 RepID=A0A0B2WYV2_METAS|nr:uncharacterized protein MAM_00468 [Metarhizium album ARSEF 1941]KHO01467.1 hypothetical protein MAM_00468 [Metarhizium album ARSEF 1941]